MVTSFQFPVSGPEGYRFSIILLKPHPVQIFQGSVQGAGFSGFDQERPWFDKRHS